MGGPSQAQGAGLSFLKSFLGGGSEGIQSGYQHEEKRTADAATAAALRDLKDREMGAERERTVFDPDTANGMFETAGMEFRTNKPIRQDVTGNLIRTHMESKRPRGGGAKEPNFDMQSAQTKALAAATDAIGKAPGVGLVDIEPEKAVAFNEAYKRYLAQAIDSFEAQHGKRTGIVPSDYIVPGQKGSWLKGRFGIGYGDPKIKNRLASGYTTAPAVVAPPAGAGGGAKMGQKDPAQVQAARAVIANPQADPRNKQGALNYLKSVGEQP